ncbi:MAG TPA: hypothetical protein VFV27_10210, partial [Nevskiaceae bacterium]|nr:hypothetical protein [Nevskiaceae bacterium]
MNEHGFAWHRRAMGLLLALALSGMAPLLVAAEATVLQPQALAQVEALRELSRQRSGVEAKIEAPLYLASLQQRRTKSTTLQRQLAAIGSSFRYVRSGKDGRVDVEVILRRGSAPAAALKRFAELGGEGKAQRLPDGSQMIRGRLALQALRPMAELGEVRSIRRMVGAVTQSQPDPLVRSEGDRTHGADLARNRFGALGQGVKICALSDGVDSLAVSQQRGELPVVDVLPGQAGEGDEGTAMLEILHDLAPQAELGFATAFNGEAQFAQNIIDLAADGCDVIVDDVIYFDESPFQDGPVAQAVNQVTAAGVLYFSSAGNEGNLTDGTSGTWEGDFTPNGQL